MEELREKSELQKAYYSLLHAVTSSNLSHVLLQTPSATLHQALGALVAGGAGHTDPGIRKTCLQVGSYPMQHYLLLSSSTILHLLLHISLYVPLFTLPPVFTFFPVFLF